MKLILCSDGDQTAAWVYANLNSLGCPDLHLVTAGELARATRWNHRVTSDGSTVDIDLEDGRHISLPEIDGVINRLNWPSRALIGQATLEDQEYATSESIAFYLSWLHSLPGRVFNRATAQGLCGSWRSVAQWAVLAGQAGFPVAPFQDSAAEGAPPPTQPGSMTQSMTRIVVFEGKAFGAIDLAALAPACEALFRLCGTSLLGIDLYQAEDGRWTFHTATPLPDMTAGGLPLLEAILTTWSTKSAAREVMQ